MNFSEDKRKNNKPESGLPLIVSLSTQQSYIIAQKIELLKSEVKKVEESRYRGLLEVNLASGDVISLDCEVSLSPDECDIPLGLSDNDIDTMFGSVLSVMIVDRFYDRLLKTRAKGARRTIIWETFCSDLIKSIKDDLSEIASNWLASAKVGD